MDRLPKKRDLTSLRSLFLYSAVVFGTLWSLGSLQNKIEKDMWIRSMNNFEEALIYRLERDPVVMDNYDNNPRDGDLTGEELAQFIKDYEFKRR
ncbi:MAG: hypothetical protein AABW71_01620 [Nanoarchaeota archaeon]